MPGQVREECQPSGRKVATTMYQSLPAPSVALAVCTPGAVDRMSSKSAEALPFWTSTAYGTCWLAPGAMVPGCPPVIRPATRSSSAGTAAVLPPVTWDPLPLSATAWSSGAVVATPE